MLDLLQKLLGNLDWNAIVNVLVAALAAWLGVPLVKKDPQKIPIIGRLWGADSTDDIDSGFRALRELDAIHERQGIDVATRRRLFVEGVDRIVAKSTEPAK